MIKTYADEETCNLFMRKPSRVVPPSVQRVALRKLVALDAAKALKDLSIPPGNRLEPLHGDRRGQHSIRINQKYRICFLWKEDDAYDVEIVDYH